MRASLPTSFDFCAGMTSSNPCMARRSLPRPGSTRTATLDISSWTRPQHDGAPLRALTVLRWARSHSFDPELSALVDRLIRSDLAFTSANWRQPSYDIWEEESGLHYYTLCVSAAALHEGADWMDGSGATALARTYRRGSAGNPANARRLLAARGGTLSLTRARERSALDKRAGYRGHPCSHPCVG